VPSSFQLNYRAEGVVEGFATVEEQMFFTSFCVKKGFSKIFKWNGYLQERLVFKWSYFSCMEEVLFKDGLTGRPYIISLCM